MNAEIEMPLVRNLTPRERVLMSSWNGTSWSDIAVGTVSGGSSAAYTFATIIGIFNWAESHLVPEPIITIPGYGDVNVDGENVTNSIAHDGPNTLVIVAPVIVAPPNSSSDGGMDETSLILIGSGAGVLLLLILLSVIAVRRRRSSVVPYVKRDTQRRRPLAVVSAFLCGRGAKVVVADACTGGEEAMALMGPGDDAAG